MIDVGLADLIEGQHIRDEGFGHGGQSGGGDGGRGEVEDAGDVVALVGLGVGGAGEPVAEGLAGAVEDAGGFRAGVFGGPGGEGEPDLPG